MSLPDMEPKKKRQRRDPSPSLSSSSSSASSSSSLTISDTSLPPRGVERVDGKEIDGWQYLSKENLIAQSPSRPHMSVEDEAKKRKIGCQYIVDLCKQLGMKNGPICVAHGLFHRFYARQSFKTHPEMDVATTCVFLSIKIEEVKDITLSKVLAAEKVVRKNSLENRPKFSSSSGSKSKADQEKILVLERVLLHSISFDICITTPLSYLKKLKPQIAKNKPAIWRQLNQYAFQHIMDSSNKTNLCLQFPPHVIAVAAIFLASKFAKPRISFLPEKATETALNRYSGKDATTNQKSSETKPDASDDASKETTEQTKYSEGPPIYTGFKNYENWWWQDLPGGKVAHREDLISCADQMLSVYQEK